MATLTIQVDGQRGTITGAGTSVNLSTSYNGVYGLTAGALVTVNPNETFTFSATPDGGNEFVGWSTNMNIVSGYLTTDTITVRTGGPEFSGWSINGLFRAIPQSSIPQTTAYIPQPDSPYIPLLTNNVASPVANAPNIPPVINRSTPTKFSATIQTVVRVIITPAATPSQPFVRNNFIVVTPSRININLSEPLITSALEFLQTAFNNYVDEDRTLKTLLNYGEDRQSVALAYRYGPVDENNVQRVQLKLLQPVPDDITVSSSVFISREVTKTLIDKVRVRFAPELDATPYLRPKNLVVHVDLDTGRSLNNMTLQKLSLQSGSVGITDIYQNKTFEDEIFRQWYSYDFNSSELNIDFTNYNNFMFYGSAAMRLETFKEKVRRLEILEDKRKQILATYSANTASVALIYLQDQSATVSKQHEDIIRAFDRYEQYLYFTPSGSNSPYSASAYYADTGNEYNSLAYWPKSGSALWSVSSNTVTDWYETQSLIAQRFDEFNENNLVNTIPSHLREDDTSDAYITFVSMIGHFFDTIKPFVDQLPNIYSRNLNPNTELSKDLVNEIAESIGFKLPTLNSVYNLADNVVGTDSEIPRRDMSAEIYKRLLHNLPFFAKAKGTKTALETLLKTFGIGPQLISVKETGTPESNSYRIYDEYTTGLQSNAGMEYIILPVETSLRSPTTLQFSCIPAETTSSTITTITGDSTWGLHITKHPTISTLSRIELMSGSSNVILLSSSYQEMSNQQLSITLQTYASTSSLYVTSTDGEDVVFTSISTNSQTFPSLWQNTQFIYLGGLGSRVISKFDGILDEIRLWNDTLSDEVILNTAFDPGSNAGDTYSSAADNLLIQLSFNKINTELLIASSSILNESPYKNIAVSPSLETIFTGNIAESDFVRYNRTVRQEMPLAGADGYVSNKIKVASAPVFIDSSKGLRLYRTQSIVQPQVKRLKKGRNKVILAMSPTEIINQNIIRNLGLENINAVLGAPTTLYTQFDKSLETLKRHYQQYHYVTVNTNRFIRIASDVGSVLNQVLDYFIPSKAAVLDGILIEPNILEQVKIPPVKNIRFYGKNTKKTLSAVGSLSSSRPDYGATFNVSDIIESAVKTVEGNYPTYRVQEQVTLPLPVEAKVIKHTTFLDMQPASVTGSYSKLETNIIKVANPIETENPTYNRRHEVWNYDSSKPARASNIDLRLNDMNKISYNDTNYGSAGAEPYNRLYTRKLFETEIETPRVGGTTSTYNTALYDIPPSTDFRDVGVYTYFNDVYGIYYFPVIIKTPVYTRPLNMVWNVENQEFDGDITWTPGTKYNIYDVVYQSVDNSYTSVSGSVKAAQGGNGNYYVFTSRPAYRPPTDGTAFNINGVPSYTPPSLDKENWELLRFLPIQKLEPRRIVYDIYTIPIPSLNNFKTTTISIDKIIDTPDRYVDSYALPTVNGNSYVTGQLTVQNIALLFGIQLGAPGLRVRLYRTEQARDADITRSIETIPLNSHGVLIDMLMNTTGVQNVGPIATLVADSAPPSGKLFYTINNTGVSPSAVNLLLYYFALQIEPRIPFGYLRKHYRFFRDNSTATKRRNYVGCLNTIDTTIDGLPPVQVFLSEGTDLLIAPTQGINEIVTGGGGTLNVT
jgi:hypothetical protein